MIRTAVVTDSNSGILPAAGETLGVYVVPMPFTIDGTTYYEGISLTADRIFRYLEAGAEVSTSQPAPGELQELWDRVLQSYDELVYIPMTSSLSGSCMSAMALAEEYGGRVQVADNKRISLLQKQSVLEAAALRDRGMRAAEIKALLEVHALEQRIYLGVDSLKQLRKGGRISPAAAAVGTALQIKPVLRLWEGGYARQGPGPQADGAEADRVAAAGSGDRVCRKAGVVVCGLCGHPGGGGGLAADGAGGVSGPPGDGGCAVSGDRLSHRAGGLRHRSGSEFGIINNCYP